MSKTANDDIAAAMGRFFDDPLGHVMYSYPWDTKRDIQSVVMKSPWKEKFWGAKCKNADCKHHKEHGEHKE